MNQNNNHHSQSYSAASIRSLKGLEGVKQNPQMYVGNVESGDGLHHLFYEVIAVSYTHLTLPTAI